MIKPISDAVKPTSTARALGAKIDFKDEFIITNEIGDAVIPPPLVPPGAWDVNNMVLINTTSIAVGGESGAYNLWMTSDGVYLFWVFGGGFSVHRVTLLTPWDLASRDMGTLQTFATSVISPFGMGFSGDGKILLTTHDNGFIYEHILTTGFDLDTATSSGKSKDLSIASPSGMHLHTTGERLFVTDFSSGSSEIHGYTLTGSDINTLAKDVANISSASIWSPQRIYQPYVREIGSRIYACHNGTNKFTQADISPDFDLTSAVDAGSFSVVGSPSIYGVWWKPDGTKVYTANNTSIISQFNVVAP